MPLLRRPPGRPGPRLPPSQRVPALSTGPLPDTLAGAPIDVEGRLAAASNLVLRVRLGAERVPAIYKPVRGERRLWDFPEGTLAGREHAAYLVSDAGGWDLVPETVLREGPLGPGSLQRWVGPLDAAPDHDLVRLDPVAQVPADHLPVVAVDTDDGPAAVSHADTPELAGVAVLDAVLNNTDRKASHLITDGGRLWAIDHGVTCHAEPKLRTVLWGWAGDPLPEAQTRRLHRLATALDGDLGPRLADLLTPPEVDALRSRVAALVERGTFPEPDPGTYPLPWPLW